MSYLISLGIILVSFGICLYSSDASPAVSGLCVGAGAMILGCTVEHIVNSMKTKIESTVTIHD